MKPLNLDNSPCSPISSNCVIWQGPDIPCIKLCTGDSVTNVVYELALKLCNLIDQVNISALDLTCLKITTGAPTDLNDLLQILINKICELNNIPAQSSTRRGNTSCPTDCIVPVAECLQTGGQTTMKLLDYVQLIGNELCSIITEISTINSSITNLTTRVEALESIPPTPAYILPSIVPDCTLADGSVIAGNAYTLDVILGALINDDNHGYCALLGALGQPSQIEIAYSDVPVDGVNISLADCPLTLEQYFAGFWITSPSNLSESFTNLWLVVKDLRDAYLTYNVVAGNSNVTVTSSTVSSTCPDVKTFSIKAKGTTVAAGDNITVDVDTTDPDNTIYTVNNEGLDTFVANIIINSTRQPERGVLGINTPGVGVAIGQDMVILRKYNRITLNNVTTDAPAGAGSFVTTVTTLPFGTFDNATGEVTITTEGTYLITGAIQIKSADTNFPIWQTSGTGSFHLGILSNSNNVFSGNSQHVQGPITYVTNVSPLTTETIPGQHTTISLTSSVQATCGPSTVVRLGIFNFTDRSYNGNTYESSDIIRFAITKLR